MFSNKCLEWEPKTLYESIVESGYNPISRENAQKINAFRVAVNTLMPWLEWDVFEKVCLGFLGLTPQFQSMEPLTVAQCACGIHILNQIRSVEYSLEVRKYIASCAQNEEFEYLPEPLQFCMPQLCPPMYKCLDCGNYDEDDLSDGQCDVCVGRYEDGIPNDKPEEGLEHLGKNIKKLPLYDYAKIADIYRRSRILSNPVNLGDSMEAIQVAKLLHCDEEIKNIERLK